MDETASTRLPSGPMLMHIGMITINWSYIESSLDALVALSFHGHGGDAIEKDLPRMLGKKLKYLRKAFRRAPALNPYSKELEAMLDDVTSMSERRHTLIHGYGERFTEHSIEFIKLRIEPRMHYIERHTVSEIELVELVQATLDVAWRLARFTLSLAKSVPINKLHKPAGER